MGDAGSHDAGLCPQWQNHCEAPDSCDGRIQAKSTSRNCPATRGLPRACCRTLCRSRGRPCHAAPPRFPMARWQRLGNRHYRVSSLASMFLSDRCQLGGLAPSRGFEDFGQMTRSSERAGKPAGCRSVLINAPGSGDSFGRKVSAYGENCPPNLRLPGNASWKYRG